MSAVARFFLRAKDWQIFVLAFGMYFIGQMVLVSSTLGSSHSEGSIANGGLFIGVVMALSTAGLFGWFWSLGSFFGTIVSPRLRLNSAFFRVALIYPPLYFVLFIATFQSLRPHLLRVILPLHFFAMFCMFYILYFVSKSLVMAESDKSASFYEYAGPFFLLWLFPIGIWFVQPRVNRLYADKMTRVR